MRPNPLQDAATFLSNPSVVTVIFWVLLLGSCAAAAFAWRESPEQRTLGHLGMWLLRLVMGTMWWQQSLWKIPPNYDGLIYWMKQLAEHAAIPSAGAVGAGFCPAEHHPVRAARLRHRSVYRPVSLMLGLADSRVGAGTWLLAMALNLWLGLYSAPVEWPWTYGFLVIIQCIFVLEPPGREPWD